MDEDLLDASGKLSTSQRLIDTTKLSASHNRHYANEIWQYTQASGSMLSDTLWIDAVEFWPRLLQVIPPTYRQSIEEARNELSFLVNMSSLSFVLFVLCLLAILGNAPSPGTSDLMSVLLNSLRYVTAGVLSLASIWFFNRAALFSVGAFGAMIRSAYDLFRLDLLHQFR
ncbi:MAG: hypothetical protein IPL71_21975 [Anaerolineales bacterium]|uniref:hypothetical protein n=1 Tax=Candidatus Villigracilis proximus TaxID=3140683 RepID=UPI00313654C0|nr:hypothetical protein [Anaerolineales bacterium]